MPPSLAWTFSLKVVSTRLLELSYSAGSIAILGLSMLWLKRDLNELEELSELLLLDIIMLSRNLEIFFRALEHSLSV